MFYTYILKSQKDGKYYYGSTGNMDKRLAEHNSGKVSATRNRIPLVLHYLEPYNERIIAIKRELFFKKRSGYKWLKDNDII